MTTTASTGTSTQPPPTRSSTTRSSTTPDGALPASTTVHHSSTDSSTDCTEACTCAAADRAPRSRRRRLSDAGRRRWRTAVTPGDDAGMATAEYAIAMIAAVGFAGLLVTVLTSSTVRELLTGLVTSALSYG